MNTLTSEQKAVAINLAIDLNQESFNQYAIKCFIKSELEANPKADFEPLLNFWKSTNLLTQQAYLAFCYCLN